MRKLYTVILNEHLKDSKEWVKTFAFYQGDLLLHFFHCYNQNDDRFKETICKKESQYVGMIYLEDKDFPIQYPITLINGTKLENGFIIPKEKKVRNNKPRKAKKRMFRVYLPGETKPRKVLVFERDNYTCVSCGETCRRFLTLDHIIPKSRGGSNKIENLQTMCGQCNRDKGDSLISSNTLGKWIELIKK